MSAHDVEQKRERSASRALRAGVLNWIAWAALIAAAMASEVVLVMALFFGAFFAIGSIITGCLGLVAGFRGIRSDEGRVRRRAWTGIALILLLGPALWAAITFGYGSQEWTEEVRLSNGDTFLLRRQVRNGPSAFMQRCTDCVSKATYGGEYLGRQFEWSTDRSTIGGDGPVALEFSGGVPILVFRVAGAKECESRGWPDPPLRVIRLERGSLLPDRWVDSTVDALPENARVNLSRLHRVPRFGSGARVLTNSEKDFDEGYDRESLAPHGARLAAVGEWLKTEPDSCRSRQVAPSDEWLKAKQTVVDAENAATEIRAELIERLDYDAEVSAEQAREQRGLKGPIGLTQGCRELEVRVATLGPWVVVPWPNPGGQLNQADVLVTPLESGDVKGSWVVPGPLSELKLIICKPGELLAVREIEPNAFLVTQLGPSTQGAISRRVALDVPDDLDGETIFWTLTPDGREIQVATYEESQSYEFDGVREWHGGYLSTLLRYRIP